MGKNLVLEISLKLSSINLSWIEQLKFEATNDLSFNSKSFSDTVELDYNGQHRLIRQQREPISSKRFVQLNDRRQKDNLPAQICRSTLQIHRQLVWMCRAKQVCSILERTRSREYWLESNRPERFLVCPHF